MFPISQVEEVEYFRPGCLGKIQKCMWDMFEKPHTSFGAKVTQTFLLDNLPFLLCSVEFFLIYLMFLCCCKMFTHCVRPLLYFFLIFIFKAACPQSHFYPFFALCMQRSIRTYLQYTVV